MVFRQIMKEMYPEIDITIPGDLELELSRKFMRNAIIDQVERYKRSVIAVSYGDPGTGKSYLNLTIGWIASEVLGRPFHVKKVVKWNVTDLLKAIKDAPSKSILIGEEAGVMIPSREWYTKTNRLFSYVTQTFRFRRIFLLLSVPNLSFIDSQVRALVQYLFETFPREIQLQLIAQYNVAGVKPREVFQDPKTGQIYYYAPKFRTPEGYFIKMPYLLFTLPPEHILEEYEEEKRKYFENLIERGIKELEELEVEEEDIYEKLDRLYTDAKKHIDKFMGPRGAIDINRLMVYYRLSPYEARLLKAKLEME